MGKEQNVQTFTKWIEAHQAHDIDTLVTFLTDDITIRSAAGANMPPAKGKDEARHHWQSIYDAFPDFRMDAVDVTSEGDTLFAEISHGGTMEGQMGPFQPTGQSYRTQGAFRIDFSEGKMCSILSYWDTAAMMKQLSLAA
ncbi:MAG: nuclear transport factor 2 family protein [Acidimicrobiia bacterium]